jgi:putative ABC transport system permease protein
MQAIKAVVQQQSSDQPVYDVQTMQEIVSDSMAAQRFPMVLLGALAVLSLLLASVGIYAVISYSVTRRVQEIGVRMALGADRVSVLGLVIKEELTVCSVGIALGVIVALLLGGIVPGLSHLLAGVGPRDPVTLAAVSVVLMSVAAVAAYIPARRATKVNPMVALRYE